jgi:hypothetical protein
VTEVDLLKKFCFKLISLGSKRLRACPAGMKPTTKNLDCAILESEHDVANDLTDVTLMHDATVSNRFRFFKMHIGISAEKPDLVSPAFR